MPQYGISSSERGSNELIIDAHRKDWEAADLGDVGGSGL